MYMVIVICSKNSLYSQFRKEADFTTARQVLFYIFSLLIGNCNRRAAVSLLFVLYIVIRLQKPIRFVSCVIKCVLI